MTLSDFLADEATGSWADEMDALPTAPAAKVDNDRGKRDDFSRDFPSRESRYPPREELPLPDKPPYTAFLGNLAYDLTDADIEEYFSPHKLVSVKIIKERDERPKGFGYVEFEDLEGLKAGLERSGRSLNNRVVRVSVAEAQKDRTFSSRGGGGFDDDKFDRQWRRDGPPPDLGHDRSASRPRSSRFSNEPTNEADDWRSAPRSMQPPLEHGSSRRGSGFSTPSEPGNEPSDWRSAPRAPRPAGPEHDGPRSRSYTPREPREPREPHAAEVEENWTMGSKFKKSSPTSESGFDPSRRGSRDNVPHEPTVDEGVSDWRTGPRRGPLPSREGQGRFGDRKSPQSSAPPTPISRRRLELIPRGNSSPSNPSSPLTSPPPMSATLPHVKPNPFGDAKPVDVTAREREIEEKIERYEHGSGSGSTHTSPRQVHIHPPGDDAPYHHHGHQPAPTAGPPAHPSTNQDSWRRRGPPSERVTPSHSRQPSSGTGGARGASRNDTPPSHHAPKSSPPQAAASNVRPTFSFAAAAASISIDEEGPDEGGANGQPNGDGQIDAVVERLADLNTNNSST
ncbi:hypothetical protein DACRYDRAFT_20254 [Dacryopinax primogenitus]|uniref:RRM domain-containing protein n=1 Tax=Dacryopinax primogenitus (strain DJM 731) TaxID=1858805 RepID=M5G8N9_DACPD|nr:uncharacterized protein DACRYDRAFT_20254 [Dacryopinax primogenitus]EJU04545.1 hypothetical protein DACRYDRAFT_20254 [Dacryopinax primogenitus]